MPIVATDPLTGPTKKRSHDGGPHYRPSGAGQGSFQSLGEWVIGMKGLRELAGGWVAEMECVAENHSGNTESSELPALGLPVTQQVQVGDRPRRLRYYHRSCPQQRQWGYSLMRDCKSHAESGLQMAIGA